MHMHAHKIIVIEIVILIEIVIKIMQHICNFNLIDPNVKLCNCNWQILK